MIKYLHDENGNITDVQLPLEIWEQIKHQSIDEYYKDEIEEINNNEPFYHNDYLQIHYLDIMSILFRPKGTDPRELYDSYFSYYDSLSPYDIELLYIFRGGTFFNLKNNNFENHSKTLTDIFELTTLRNTPLTRKQFDELVLESYKRNEISFLQFFKINYKVNRNINSIRLNRKSERDRLFIYDILSSTFITESIAEAKQLEKTKNFLSDMRKTLIETLANFFYNGNKAQVYRAQKQTVEKLMRINSNFKIQSNI